MEPSAIEAITELVDESLEVLRSFQVMSPHEEPFEVGGDRGCPGQPAIHLGRRHFRMRLMMMAHLGKGWEAKTSIGPQISGRGKRLSRPGLRGQRAGRLGNLESGESGPSVTCADGHPNGLGACRLVPPLPLDDAMAELCIIQLNETSQLVAAVPLGHRRPDLMAHRPDGLIGSDAQEPLGFQHGDAMFVVAHEQDQPEPFS